MEADPAAARSEWLGEFRDDLAGWASVELIEAAVDRGVAMRSKINGVRYSSFSDPSGGARDSFTCAIAHAEGQLAVLDALLEIKAPFNPTSATRQVADLLAQYDLHETTADRYAAGFAVDAFARNGIKLKHSERDRSELYLECLPLFTAGRVRLIDSKRLVSQFAALERRTSALGKDRVDHGPGGADDVCNSAAGALVLAANRRKPIAIPSEAMAWARTPYNQNALRFRITKGATRTFFGTGNQT